MPPATSRIWNPASYQGGRARRRYFEGWYFKQVSADRSEAWSFIPGLSLGAGALPPHPALPQASP